MTNLRVLQLFLIALVLTTTGMLAISINHLYLIPLALVVTIGAFSLTDALEWVSIEGWVANVASLGILAWSVFEFYPADSAGKLIAVGKLLVCLQAVLLFQKKSPRLIWQIMVLSLLQVVITTIFSVQFEGGVLFVIFFAISGVTLVLQNRFTIEHTIENRNQAATESRTKIESERSFSERLAFWRFDMKPQPTVTSLESLKQFSVRSLAVLPGVAMIALMFTVVVFLTAPRNVDPWFSPISYKVNSSGVTKTLDLEETGEIKNTKRRIFEATFLPPGGDETEGIHLNEPAYFRGIALSNLTFKDGKTRWNAAFERISGSTYQPIPIVQNRDDVRLVKMEITMEKTTDPLLYSLMPPGLTENTSGDIRFCHEISALTRCRENEEIDYATYEYELTVPLSQRNVPGKAWPYVANERGFSIEPMSKNPAEERWLTRMDRKNYPTLVRIADRIAKEVKDSGGGRYEFVKALESHFLDPANYSYTLDFRDVSRDLSIDPNEDFVANFKTGHCSVFASAMTLMLRSQGIPARLVVGFYGGEFNPYNQGYIVRAWHSHAWVEIYMPLEECRSGNLETWQYNTGGAWLIGDPTPPQPDIREGLQTENAIDLARTVWQDYVLGMEANEGANGDSSLASTLVAMFNDFDANSLSTKFARSREHGLLSILQPLFFVFLILAGIIGLLRMLILNAGYEEEQPDTAVGKIKRFFADAIGLISTDLREWVIGHDSDIAFYKQLTEVLEKQDLVREPAQTHREFAAEVASKFISHPSSELISSTVKEATDAFNRVRFGLEELTSEERESIDHKIVKLESALEVNLA